jgi:enoyl-CoA hydratase/3-hydroxyacyl-CoA dehydrogenase
MNAKEALEIGMVSKVVDDIPELLQEAVQEVNRLQGKITRIPDGKVELPDFNLPDPPAAGKLPLSREVIAITVKTIQAGASAETFSEALERGYQGNAEVACTDSAREGITAFLEKRRPEFRK